VGYASVFQFFAAAEPYISVTITYGATEPHAMIRESSSVSEGSLINIIRANYFIFSWSFFF